MTGDLERPSQETPENRKAAPRERTRRRSVSPRAAARSIRAAERALLDAAHRAEVASRLAALTAKFAALLSSAEQLLDALVQSKIGALDPALSLAARAAAIENLRGDHTAALVQLRAHLRQEERATKRAARLALGTAQRARKRGLRARHVVEVVILNTFFAGAMTGCATQRTAYPTVRQLAAKLRYRRRDARQWPQGSLR